MTYPASSATEYNEFVAELKKQDGIDEDFIALLTKEEHATHGEFKHHHEEIASFMGYMPRSRSFRTLVRKTLVEGTRYALDPASTKKRGEA